MAAYGGIFYIAFDTGDLSESERYDFQGILKDMQAAYDENQVIMHWLFDIKPPEFAVEMDTLSAHPETVFATKALFEELGERFPNLRGKCVCSVTNMMAGGDMTEHHDFSLERGALVVAPETYDYLQVFNIAISDQNFSAEDRIRLHDLLSQLSELKHDNDGLVWLRYMESPTERCRFYYFENCDREDFRHAMGIETFKATYGLFLALRLAFPTLCAEGSLLLYEDSLCDTVSCDFTIKDDVFSWEFGVDIDCNSISPFNVDGLIQTEI